MKQNPAIVVILLGAGLTLTACAQNLPYAPPPPPLPAAQAAPPPAGAPATYNSRVSAVVYGPQQEVQALTLRNGVSVTLPPDLASRVQSLVIRGTRVQVSGFQRVIAGQTSLVAQSITANRQTLIAAQAPPPDPRAAVAAGPPPPPPDGPRGPRGRRSPGAPLPPPPDANAPPPAPSSSAGGPPPPQM